MNFVFPRTPSNSVSDVKLSSLALSGMSADFSRVTAVIDEMVTLPKTEQGEDDSKKAYYTKSCDQKENEAKVLLRLIAGHKEAIENCKDQPSLTDALIDAARKSMRDECNRYPAETTCTVHRTDRKRCCCDGIAQARRQQCEQTLHTRAAQGSADG